MASERAELCGFSVDTSCFAGHGQSEGGHTARVHTCSDVLTTWLSTLPFRCFSGASTSQTSGSVAARPGSVDEALAKMRGLMGDHWEPCEVCRGYERLGWADIVRMHGFVIVKLRGRDARDDCKFMRLDWGHDGFLFQTGPTDQEFRAYCGEPSADVGELATSLIQALSVAPAERDYAVVGPRVSMKMLIAEIDSKKHIAYDMALWNCNHFANNLMEVLTKED